MLQRGLVIGRALALVVFGVGVAGCTGGGAGSTGTSAAGTTGAAGATTSGAAGTGAVSTGTGGMSSGAAGSGGETTGAAGAAAGGAGGVAGGAAGGQAGTGSASGGAGGTTLPGTGGGGGAATAGTTGASGPRSGPSAGCMGEVPLDALGMPKTHTLTVSSVAAKYPTYVNRKYFTTLPMPFNPTKPYPVVFWGPGCGATGSEGSSFTTGHFRQDIIYVQLLSVTGCFQAGKQGTADSPDGPYFDQVVAEVEANYCVDKGRLFAAGTSSGAWLSNYLGCARGNVLRGVAADSGGLQHDHGTCTGGAAVMEMPGDSTVTNEGGFDIGSGQARDMFVTLNGCTMTPTMMTFAKANNCQVYGSCASPVVWCNVGGAHQSGNNVIAESAWAFWGTLK